MLGGFTGLLQSDQIERPFFESLGQKMDNAFTVEYRGINEVGLKGFDADTVFGFYAPGGTPADVIAKLNGEINRILGTPALRERIAALGGEPAPMSPTQFAASPGIQLTIL